MTISTQPEPFGPDQMSSTNTLFNHSTAKSMPTPVLTGSTLSTEPANFIQHLAVQNQLLACLKWLLEFQVLACIPLTGSISLQEVADVAGVPEAQLCRVVRMTATAGFLQESQPRQISHTALSAHFVTNLTFHDALMFLAETAAPTALQMVATTPSDEYPSAYCAAFCTPQLFQSACAQRTKLRRQWSAYRHTTGGMDNSVAELLTRLNWRRLGNACIVEACAHSTETAMALAEMHPALRFIVQMPPETYSMWKVVDGLNGRITVQEREPTAIQVVKGAAVYILRLDTSAHLPARLLAELRTHLDVLCEDPSSTLILTLPLLPEPGVLSPEIETQKRVRDLCHHQLMNQCELEVDELLKAIESVGNSNGRLVASTRLRSPDSLHVALGVKYRAFADRTNTAETVVSIPMA